MTVRDDRGDVKQTTTGFRGPLMVQSLTSAKSKFLSLGTISVVPILGSGDIETIDENPISRMARAIGELDGYQYCPKLLYKKEVYRRLHTIRGADNRDAEVEGKYFSHSFDALGLNKPNAVLLVDDIVTRGTTMNDAARAIKKSNGHLIINGIALGKAERRYQSRPELKNDRIADYLEKIRNEKAMTEQGQLAKNVVVNKLHELRSRIWLETDTQAGPRGILKARLIERYINCRVTTIEDWQDAVGIEKDIIFESHKMYLPEIIEILRELKS